MNCPRCQGLMCPAELRDWEGSSTQDCFHALRCILCGEIVDLLILSNRRRTIQREAIPRKGRARHRAPVVIA